MTATLAKLFRELARSVCLQLGKYCVGIRNHPRLITLSEELVKAKNKLDVESRQCLVSTACPFLMSAVF